MELTCITASKQQGKDTHEKLLKTNAYGNFFPQASV